MISIAKPFLGEEERKAVCDVIESGMIACGSVVTEFEEAFAEHIGAQYGVATTSGTTALEVALRALNIGVGDKVLTTPFSFIASTNCIVYVGATPVFVDIDPDTFNIDPKLIEQKLQEDPGIKALLIVHLFGQPCDMEPIMEIVKKYKILLIEDCAQAHSAAYRNKKVGTFGDVAAFSFYPTKNMTTSEGGIVLTNSTEIAEKSRMLINHGMKIRYYHDQIGYNYRMTNLAAAIGLCQLKKLEHFNRRRFENATFYNKNIHCQGVALPRMKEDSIHCFHQYSILIKENKRDVFIKHLEEHEIGYGVFYPVSIPEQACFRSFGFETHYHNTDVIKNLIISLPVHPQLEMDELNKVAKAVNSFKFE